MPRTMPTFLTHPLRAALLALLITTPLAAQAWWQKDWTVRTRLVVDTGAQGLALQGALSGFPLAVRLHSGNFDFSAAKDDGSDLRVVAGDDKTPLKFHLERWDPVNELAVLWVQLPTVAPGSDKNTVHVYAGNAQAAVEPAQAGGFDAASRAVFHLAKPDGAALAGSPKATAPFTPEANALLGGGARLSGTPVVWPADAATKTDAGSALTWSLWVKPEGNSGTLLQQGGLSLGLQAGKLTLKAGNKTVTGADLPAGAWAHVALVMDQGKASLYLNGAAAGQGEAALPALDGELAAGRDFSGAIDEIELAATARSAEWLRLSADSQGSASKAVKAFKEDAASAGGEGGHGGYFGILFANLTTDAWIVIGILGVMFVIAVWVMVTKTMMVVRFDRANRHFLQTFRNAGAELMTVASDAQNTRSPLYRLYQAGVRELDKRHIGQPVAPGAAEPRLSGASIDAVKAAVDADLVRETHQLNSGIVLLTIAISGGPFLGLLGTVVGVMITFAAIAAAGDVNVNAIAPGIAAALLATVAGLGVAIPALFGYNYLAARIKNITSDMQIFIDEFITRIAERYGQA